MAVAVESPMAPFSAHEFGSESFAPVNDSGQFPAAAAAIPAFTGPFGHFAHKPMTKEHQTAGEEPAACREEPQFSAGAFSPVENGFCGLNGPESSKDGTTRLLNGTGIATVFLDGGGRLTHCTPAAAGLLGLVADDFGSAIGEIARRHAGRNLLAGIEAMLGNPAGGEQEMAAEDGRWFLRRAAAWFSDGSRVEGLAVSFIEVTALKQAERESRRLAGELEQRIAERTEQLRAEIDERRHAEEEARARAAELAHVHRLYTAGELATALAHELGQPLSAIASYGEASLRTLRHGEIDKKRLANNLERIAAQAQRAGRIIRELRGFLSKEETARVPVEVNHLVRSTVELLEVEAREQRVRLELDLAEGLPPVIVQPIQIEHVLVNLLHNAMDAMGEAGLSGNIGIATRAENPEFVRVTVHDSGPGLDSRTLKQLFDPFYSTKAKGLGMGLAISRTLIEAHGGRIWAEAGRGGIFHFILPATP